MGGEGKRRSKKRKGRKRERERKEEKREKQGKLFSYRRVIAIVN